MSEYGSITVMDLGHEPSHTKRQTFKLLLDSVLVTYDVAKHRISQSRVGKSISNRLKKIDRFITHPKVVKAATFGLGMETFLGFFTCLGTVTIMFASGNYVLGALMIGGYVVTTFVRYVLARNAMLETHNVKEAS